MIRAAAMGQRTKTRNRPNRTRKRLGRLPPTPEFLRFGLHFHQDILLDDPTFEEAALRVIAGFKGDERRRLRDFIGQVLASDLSPDELSKLWGLTGSDWRFYEAPGFRAFLAYVHDSLRKGL